MSGKRLVSRIYKALLQKVEYMVLLQVDTVEACGNYHLGAFFVLFSYTLWIRKPWVRRCGRGWRFEKGGGMAESPDRGEEWVEGKPAGELSGSTEDPYELMLMTCDGGDQFPQSCLSLQPVQPHGCRYWDLTCLGILPRECRHIIPLLCFWSLKS